MTALAEALLAAQRSALAALNKAYVARVIDRDVWGMNLHAIGCEDNVDVVLLLASLDVCREFGVPAPAATTPPPRDEAKPAALIGDVWQTGKHKGQTLAETPYDYLQWYAEKGPDEAAREAARTAMQQRDEVPF